MGLFDFLKKKKVNVAEASKEEKQPKKAKTVKKLKTVSLNPIDEAINNVIAQEFREEAKEIINTSPDGIKEEFLKYYKENSGNICCLVLDKAKRDLIAQGKMTLKEGDAFGHPFML